LFIIVVCTGAGFTPMAGWLPVARGFSVVAGGFS
jgi:hypothetical protein